MLREILGYLDVFLLQDLAVFSVGPDLVSMGSVGKTDDDATRPLFLPVLVNPVFFLPPRAQPVRDIY